MGQIQKTVTVLPQGDNYQWEDVDGAVGNWLSLTQNGSTDTWTFATTGVNNTGSDRTATFRVLHSTYSTWPGDPGLKDEFTITQLAAAAQIFECSDAGISIANGTVGQAVNPTVSSGAFVSVTPATYQNGSNSYTVVVTVPSGYANTGNNLNCVINNVSGTQAQGPQGGQNEGVEFTCSTAGLTVDDGTIGDAVTYSVSSGTVASIDPSTYASGTQSYTADITVPAVDPNGDAYSNAGQTIQCSDNATGTAAPTYTTTWNLTDNFTGAVLDNVSTGTTPIGALVSSADPSGTTQSKDLYIVKETGYQPFSSVNDVTVSVASGTVTNPVLGQGGSYVKVTLNDVNQGQNATIPVTVSGSLAQIPAPAISVSPTSPPAVDIEGPNGLNNNPGPAHDFTVTATGFTGNVTYGCNISGFYASDFTVTGSGPTFSITVDPQNQTVLATATFTASGIQANTGQGGSVSTQVSLRGVYANGNNY